MCLAIVELRTKLSIESSAPFQVEICNRLAWPRDAIYSRLRELKGTLSNSQSSKGSSRENCAHEEVVFMVQDQECGLMTGMLAETKLELGYYEIRSH